MRLCSSLHACAIFCLASGAPTKILQGSIPTMIVTCHANNKIGVFEYFTGRLLAVGEGHSKLTGALLINNGRNLVKKSPFFQQGIEGVFFAFVR